MLVTMGFREMSELSPLYKHAEIPRMCTYGKTPTTASIHLVCQHISNFDYYLDEQRLPAKVRDETIRDIKGYMKDILKDQGGKRIQVEGDPVIQIGTVFYTYGLPDDDPDKITRHIAVIGPEPNMKKEEICDPLDEYDILVEPCASEKFGLRLLR